MRVLGVDPGSRICGYAVVECEPGANMTCVECGVLTAPRDRPAEVRLAEIASGLREVVGELSPQQCAVEDVFTHKNPRSALALAQARGVVLAVAGLAGLEVFSYAPRLVKKCVTGRGAAPKEQVAKMAQSLVGLRRTPEADAADALAIAITHAMTVRPPR